MKSTLVRIGATALMITALAGCGGGGSDSPPPGPAAPTVETPSGTVGSAISTAAALATNDTATNSSASFAVLQNAGVPAVTVNSPPKVNFTVFSDGAVKQGLAITNVSFILAKLVPGTAGNPDQWVSYTYRTETAAATVGPGGKPVLASAKQATTDPKQTDPALLASQLVFNSAGYYTYTFSTDIKDPAKTNGVTFEPNRTHRIAIQLSYVNKAGATIRANPNFDFTIDASGNAIAVTDASKTRKVVDIATCNGCHNKLALHGGGRVDTQYCVMCHNSGTTDANSGNVLDFRTMIHKIHAGRLLAATAPAEDYTIWGNSNNKHSYAEVGFPQDLRNCTVCHTGANPKTPQGDNWKTRPSKEACLTCHKSDPASPWYAIHITGLNSAFGTSAAAFTNGACVGCHTGSNINAEQVHFNQIQQNAANYKMNIEGASYDAATRKVTVKYFLSNPNNGNAAYNLVTSACTGTPVVCANTTKFGNLRFVLGYQNLIGQPTDVTEFSAGSGATVYAYTGTNDGFNHYTAQISVPADSATAAAAGTARIVSYGQVIEAKLDAVTRQAVAPAVNLDVGVQHAYTELALTGTLTPRRQVVSNEKCNVCHGLLGTTSGSNTLANAFHRGARNTVEACVVCHDANRQSTTVMADGSAFNESFQFKRMIHAIHGNGERTYPFTHGNLVVGAFGKDGLRLSDKAPMTAGTINYAAEVAYPGILRDCNTCHVNNSYRTDLSVLGTVIQKPIDPVTKVATTDRLKWNVVSPYAASCTSCHDSAATQAHAINEGAKFGTMTQGEVLAGGRFEQCVVCHGPRGEGDLDVRHGIQ